MVALLHVGHLSANLSIPSEFGGLRRPGPACPDATEHNATATQSNPSVVAMDGLNAVVVAIVMSWLASVRADCYTVISMTADPQKHRRWFQFRIGTLLIAVLVLSLPLSWFAWRVAESNRQQAMGKALCNIGSDLAFSTKPVPKFMHGIFGISEFYEISCVCLPEEFGDPEAVCLDELKYAVRIDLGGTRITDIGLEHVEGLTNLQILTLGGTCVSDAGLEHLTGLTNLESLYLNQTSVTPEGVKRLQEALPNCKIEY